LFKRCSTWTFRGVLGLLRWNFAVVCT
jgi:hypothetical protein